MYASIISYEKVQNESEDTQCRPIDCLGSGFEPEHKCWDPKDGGLCLSRVKSGETLMEARNGSNVQIDRNI